MATFGQTSAADVMGDVAELAVSLGAEEDTIASARERYEEAAAEMAEQPTAARLPAIEAEQAHPWQYIGMDYAAQAQYMDELAGWLAEDVTP